MEGQIRADLLVRAAMAAAEAESPRQLARELGLTNFDSPKRVERWLRGENSPRYDETISLLRLAGLLDEDRVAAALAAATALAHQAEQQARDVR